MTHPLLTVLQEAIAPNQKRCAIDLWPESSPAAAESNLSRVFSGQRHIPPDLIDWVLQSPGRKLLLDYCEERSRTCPEQMQARAVEAVEHATSALAEATELLRRAETEREFKPLRVPSTRQRGRAAS